MADRQVGKQGVGPDANLSQVGNCRKSLPGGKMQETFPRWENAGSFSQVSKLKHLLTLYEHDYFFFPGPPWWPKAGSSGNTIMELVDLARGGGT